MQDLHMHVKPCYASSAILLGTGRVIALRMARPINHRKPRQWRRHFLKEWREYLEITQERAMGLLDWSQSKISRIENGRIRLTLDDLAAAAAAYNRTEFELLNVNPFKDGEVIDLTRLIQQGDAEQRKRIEEYARFVIRNR
jgi:transcriptional regulator with XRE-family HTH domain